LLEIYLVVSFIDRITLGIYCQHKQQHWDNQRKSHSSKINKKVRTFEKIRQANRVRL